MKNLFIFLMMLGMSMSAMAQSRIHVVKIGEDFASIAEYYGITEKELLDANPKNRKMCYVGLKLNLPEAAIKNLEEKERKAAEAAKAKAETKTKSSKFNKQEKQTAAKEDKSKEKQEKTKSSKFSKQEKQTAKESEKKAKESEKATKSESSKSTDSKSGKKTSKFVKK